MALDREYIKKKVKQAIEQLPSTGIVIREVFNRYNEKVGYCIVSELTGVIYSSSSYKNYGISIDNSGVNTETSNKNYMVVYDENSKVVKSTDIIFVEEDLFKVTDPGENLKIYCLMQLEKYEGLRKEGDTIIENDNVYPLLSLPLDLNLRFGDLYEYEI